MNLQSKIILFLCGIVGVLFVILLLQNKKISNIKNQLSDREQVMKYSERDWTNKYGKVVHEADVIKLESNKIARELLKKDSVLKHTETKLKELHSLSKTVVENHYHIQTPIVKKTDSTYKIKEWKNNWLTVNGEFDIRKNIANLEYLHRDTISQVIKYKRKKFLGIVPHGPIMFKTETISADTNSKIVHQITYIKE